MFQIIADVLSKADLSTVLSHIDQLDWKDGGQTAGHAAVKVKRNQQADLSSVRGKRLKDLLKAAIDGHPVFRAAARPAQYSPLLISRTGEGGGYGAHIDNALMGKGSSRMRTDLSYTLFLSAPDNYEGGALALDLPGGVQLLKPNAGDLVLYPSTLIHEVQTVTNGERLAAVGWVQSDVRDPSHRQILFDLEQVRVTMRARNADRDALIVLDKAFSNLLRLWATP